MPEIARNGDGENERIVLSLLKTVERYGAEKSTVDLDNVSSSFMLFRRARSDCSQPSRGASLFSAFPTFRNSDHLRVGNGNDHR
jgi:hypothetical protein